DGLQRIVRCGHAEILCSSGSVGLGEEEAWNAKAAGVSIALRETAASASPTARLIAVQCGRVGQKLVRVHSSTWTEHWVSPMSPSIAATTSATEIAAASRARRYPPLAPRAAVPSPA